MLSGDVEGGFAGEEPGSSPRQSLLPHFPKWKTCHGSPCSQFWPMGSVSLQPGLPQVNPGGPPALLSPREVTLWWLPQGGPAFPGLCGFSWVFFPAGCCHDSASCSPVALAHLGMTSRGICYLWVPLCSFGSHCAFVGPTVI